MVAMAIRPRVLYTEIIALAAGAKNVDQSNQYEMRARESRRRSGPHTPGSGVIMVALRWIRWQSKMIIAEQQQLQKMCSQ